ncbi:MAG: prepilin-type N-terminal cleavage/methylation domain-containing protein [bacterium]
MKKPFIRSGKAGFTLAEMLIVIAITAILGSMAFASFGRLINYTSIEGQAQSIRSHIERARIFTLASKNNSSFGVIFSTTTARVFQGTAFVSASSSDQVLTLDSKDSIININFTGGGSTIYFNKITGEPNATGTITVTATSNNLDQRTIVIYQTGIVDIQ